MVGSWYCQAWGLKSLVMGTVIMFIVFWLFGTGEVAKFLWDGDIVEEVLLNLFRNIVLSRYLPFVGAKCKTVGGRVGRFKHQNSMEKAWLGSHHHYLGGCIHLCCQRDDQEWSLDAIERRELAGKKAKLAAAELAKLSSVGTKEVVLIFLEGKGLLGGWALTVQMEHIVTRTDTSLAKEGGVPWGSEFDSVWLLLGDVNAFNSSPLVLSGDTQGRQIGFCKKVSGFINKNLLCLIDGTQRLVVSERAFRQKVLGGGMRRLQDGRIYSRLGFWSRQMGGRCLQFTASHRAVLFLSPAVVGTPTLGESSGSPQ
ncbi:hypothetical protein CK203_043348 [Vitis vinifera]|uniref:Uncharacterized protein n=1 Tax=Vitis vinifera TaxID=29760 RepID=A0A438GYA0_VITVI|nr:hypothetical protein CK203_043348 [Vitis vinifera]